MRWISLSINLELLYWLRQVQSEGYLVAVGSNDGNTSMLQLSSSLSQCNRWVTGVELEKGPSKASQSQRRPLILIGPYLLFYLSIEGLLMVIYVLVQYIFHHLRHYTKT